MSTSRRTTRPAPRWAGRLPSGKRVAMVVAGLAGTALAARVLYDSSDELLTAADQLTAVQPGWMVAAVLAEALCYLARGGAQRVVLRSGAASTGTPGSDGPRGVGALVLGATTLAGDAAAYCLPFGFAAGGVVMVGQLRRRRVNEVLAGWTFTVATLLYVAVLAVLGIVAVQLAGAAGDVNPVPGLQEASLVLLAALVAVGTLTVLVRRAPPDGLVARLLDPLRRLVAQRRLYCMADGVVPGAAAVEPGRLRRTGRTAMLRLREWWTQLRSLRLSPAVLATAAAAMLVSWLSDIAVLALAFVALGMSPPWLGLLLAYCAGQIASSVPITPGGLGVVEGSLTLALVAFGGSATGTLAAVLLYRLVAYWSVIPAGALAWLTLRATSSSPAVSS